MNYYNEFDPNAAAWLRELIKQGHIPAGEVDERSIADVWPNDLRGFVQCHFFAGIGGWPLALRLAGWPADKPVWTGSCPCQPFSVAGKRKGPRDSRHLWPKWVRLIAECNGLFRVPTVFGEQVASADGRIWLSGVRSSMAHLGYAVGAADLCAAGVGAPHIRQRLFWVANSEHSQRRPLSISGQDERNGCHAGREEAHGQLGARCEVRGMGYTEDTNGRSEQSAEGATCRRCGSSGNGRLGVPEVNGCEMRPHIHGELHREGSGEGCEPCGLADVRGQGSQVGEADGVGARASAAALSCGDVSGVVDSEGIRARAEEQSGQPYGFWSDFELIPCADNKSRRIEPGTFPLAHGVSGRVGLLRGYGNAINPHVAAEFIKAFCEVI